MHCEFHLDALKSDRFSVSRQHLYHGSRRFVGQVKDSTFLCESVCCEEALTAWHKYPWIYVRAR